MVNKTELADLESMGFKVKQKPKMVTGKPIPKPKVIAPLKPRKPVAVEIEAPAARPLAVPVESLPVAEVNMNKAVSEAIEKLADAMKELGYKPKVLECGNMQRDPRGLLTSFQVKVIE